MRDTPEPRPEGPEAKLLYGPGGYQVIKPGTFVTCSVTGRPVPLEQLRYWNVDRQEAYFDAAAAFRRQTDIESKK
jgi:hypothetical protein